MPSRRRGPALSLPARSGHANRLPQPPSPTALRATRSEDVPCQPPLLYFAGAGAGAGVAARGASYAVNSVPFGRTILFSVPTFEPFFAAKMYIVTFSPTGIDLRV